MPLRQGGIFHRSSDIDQETEQQIKDIFQSLDQEIERLSRERGLMISQVKLREPVQLCVLVGDSDIFVAATSHIPGGVSREQFHRLVRAANEHLNGTFVNRERFRIQRAIWIPICAEHI